MSYIGRFLSCSVSLQMTLLLLRIASPHIGLTQSVLRVTTIRRFILPHSDTASSSYATPSRILFGRYPTGLGGKGGIRTHGRDQPSVLFKSTRLNHSRTFPIMPRNLPPHLAVSTTKTLNPSTEFPTFGLPFILAPQDGFEPPTN
jgi:hypothetical protein